jgi:hypothetical protein
MTAHPVAVRDSYVYGFAKQDRGLPFDTEEEAAAKGFGLDLVLNALKKERDSELVGAAEARAARVGGDG